METEMDQPVEKSYKTTGCKKEDNPVNVKQTDIYKLPARFRETVLYAALRLSNYYKRKNQAKSQRRPNLHNADFCRQITQISKIKSAKTILIGISNH